jgi:hypothetical protein
MNDFKDEPDITPLELAVFIVCCALIGLLIAFAIAC